MKNCYSVNECLEKNDRFIRTGFPELGRNEVFFDKHNKYYIKFYTNRNHYNNEKRALNFYRSNNLVPQLLFESDMCICIEPLGGEVLDECQLTLEGYYNMGVRLKELHEVSQKQFCHNGDDIWDWRSKYFCEERSKWKRLCSKLADNNKWGDVIEDTNRLLPVFDEKNAYPIVLCHNDYCDRNILFTGKDITGIIDFEKSRFADPVSDLATIVIKAFGSKKLESFLDAYSLDHHENDVDRLAYFSIYKALEIVTWAEHKDMSFYQKAVDFLSRWESLYEFV